MVKNSLSGLLNLAVKRKIKDIKKKVLDQSQGLLLHQKQRFTDVCTDSDSMIKPELSSGYMNPA